VRDDDGDRMTLDLKITSLDGFALTWWLDFRRIPHDGALPMGTSARTNEGDWQFVAIIDYGIGMVSISSLMLEARLAHRSVACMVLHDSPRSEYEVFYAPKRF